MAENRKPIFVYLLLTFALSCIFYYLIIKAGTLSAGHGLYVVGLMWCPGTAGIITRLALKPGTAPLGWRWGKTKYQAASYFIPVAYAAIAYAAVWSFGLGRFHMIDQGRYAQTTPLKAVPLYLIMMV